MLNASRNHAARTWVWVVVTLFVFLPLFSLVIYRITGDSALRKALETLQAQGHPVTLEELNDRYAIPPGAENAVDLYLNAFSHLVKRDDNIAQDLPLAGDADLPARTAPFPTPMQDAIQQHLAANQETLILLHEAANVPHCRYPVDLSQGFDTVMPWLKDVRTSTRLLQLEAMVHIDSNDLDSAIDSVQSGMALGRSLQASTLVEQLVRIAVLAVNLQTMERLVNQATLSDAQLLALTDIIRSENVKAGLYRAIQGERCVGLTMYRSPSTISLGNNSMKTQVRIMWPMRAVGYLQRDSVCYLNLMQDMLEALELPTHEGIKKAGQINVKNYGGLFTRILAPALARVAQLTGRAYADQHAALIALAIERYRLAHSRLPDRLEALVPDFLKTVPLDPFDGQPLRYQQRSPGYVVYSIGEDLTDDGGKERAKKRGNQKQPWDVTFIVER
ncbi:hypothetical protein ACFL6U_00845 [Planctomycetota bacterium]